MLEITSEDIAELADDDLRALVARLCEAEMRKRGLTASAVTWGGAQDAPDGGIDVRVDLPGDTAIDGLVPRPATGFQVKKPDMTTSEIASEMRPKGSLRTSIEALAAKRGAYIIVSGNSSAADCRLTERRDAMKAALNDCLSGSELFVDFYDRTRVATWLRDHPGLMPWARERAGRPISGWQSYGAWANLGEGLDGEFLVDEASRIRRSTNERDQSMSTLLGIQRMRQHLGLPGKSVRLVGLSGVGKTRLVQALFDCRVGSDALDPALALYTNLADSPDPAPAVMVANLIASGTRHIVVVDNCPPDIHRRLTELVGAMETKLSLITVEYDIRDDQPEATEVFELQTSSLGVTEKLIRKRFPQISRVDAERIAGFSGGNARVAIALAGTVQRGESVSSLNDAQIFERLFHQNHAPDLNLLRAAQTFALVYSFDGEDTRGDGELARLGKLAGQDAESLYTQAVELRRRDLVQARSHWRAVLPHAVANRLAKLGLENLPLKTIEQHLVSEAPDRIRRSFSRRLGYLHDSTEAKCIVEGWLTSGGILSDVGILDDLHAEMLRNVAPVAPEAVLTALERATHSLHGPRCLSCSDQFVPLLRSLAYDPDLFERCTELLVMFALAEHESEKSDASSALVSLFSIYLSGTHATIKQRVRAVEAFLKSNDPKRQVLGLEVLRMLLRTSNFVLGHDFQFGSHSRDHGYRPTTLAQAQAWYRTVLQAAETIALSNLPIAEEVRSVVGESFRGLWEDALLYDELERIGCAFLDRSHWREGWIGVRQVLNRGGSTIPACDYARLVRLEEKLRPKTLVDNVRSIVLSRSPASVDLTEYEDNDDNPVSAWERTELLAEELGEEVGMDADALVALLPELVTKGGRLFRFGRGLAAGSTTPRAIWEALVTAYANASDTCRSVQILKGFISRLEACDPELAASLLDEAVDHPVLGPRFPELQSATTIDAAGVQRLRRSLSLGNAPVQYFDCLAWGGSHEPISGSDLRDLVEEIAAKPGGDRVGLEIIYFRLISNKQEKHVHEPEIIEAGRSLLGKMTFDRNGSRDDKDHQWGVVVATCLIGEAGEPGTRHLCQSLRAAASAGATHVWDYRELLEALCKVQPRIVLDTLFGGSEADRQQSIKMMRWFESFAGYPLDVLPVGDVVAWCDEDRDTRYVTMASVVSYLRGTEEDVASQWSDIALTLLDRSSEPVAVARAFTERFRPMTWSGSLADILEGRKGLLAELEASDNAELAAFAKTENVRLSDEIDAERKWEAKHDRRIGERFE